MKTPYRYVKGKRISEKEYQRRLKISKSLKKFHSTKKTKVKKNATTSKPVKTKPRRTKSNTKPKTPKTTKKVTKKTRKTDKRKTVSTRKNFTTQRTRSKVKTFPKKHFKSVFMYTAKKRFLLNKPIRVLSPTDIEKVAIEITPMLEPIYKFFIETKGKKRKAVLNLGYVISLQFISKDKMNKKRIGKKDLNVIDTVSFQNSIEIRKRDDIEKAMGRIIDKMLQRFDEYITRQGFYKLIFKGLEAEFEL